MDLTFKNPAHEIRLAIHTHERHRVLPGSDIHVLR